MFMGKTALVTGSTSGIGLGIAQTLAAQGASVVLNGFGDARRIERLRAEMAERHGVQVRHDAADMLCPEAIEDMVNKVLAEFGSVDLLINNAGIDHVAPLDDFPVDKWNAILSTNLSAVFHTARLALPAMKRKGFGRIVNIASAHALVAGAYKSAHVSAAHGVAGFTKALALEVADAGITVNAVCPGHVLTPAAEKRFADVPRDRDMTLEELVRKVLLATPPTKKFVAVEQVAALTAFLCSDDAASITGALLPIDGGRTVQ